MWRQSLTTIRVKSETYSFDSFCRCLVRREKPVFWHQQKRSKLYLVLENKVMSSRSFSETGLDQDPVKTVERGEEVHPTGSTARVVIKHQWKCVIRRNCILWLRFMRVQDHHSTLSPKTNSRWLLYHNRLILLQWDTIHHFISTSEPPSHVFNKWHFN